MITLSLKSSPINFVSSSAVGVLSLANAFPDGKTLEQAPPTGLGIGTRFIGGARMTIHNIAPRGDGTVLFWLEVEWLSDLNVMTLHYNVVLLLPWSNLCEERCTLIHVT